MKRWMLLLLTLLLLLTAAGCGGEQKKGADSAPGQVDVDLTDLSSTVVYSEVYNMLYGDPESYVGKTVRMEGIFAVYEDEVNQKNYYACIIADATACCSQGLEFELSGKHTYPDDYPELGTDITVTGTFQLYQEGEGLYCHLTDAVME